jgi:hypothetical protein
MLDRKSFVHWENSGQVVLCRCVAEIFWGICELSLDAVAIAVVYRHEDNEFS